MIYHGTDMTETIWYGLEGEDCMHCIELVKDSDNPVFYVTACCNEEWVWAFEIDGESNYEMIKHTIMDTIFECDDPIELLDELDCIFEEDFMDFVVHAYGNECCCEECECRCCME